MKEAEYLFMFVVNLDSLSCELSSFFFCLLVAQLLKNLPTMQKTLVQFPGQEDTLEKG